LLRGQAVVERIQINQIGRLALTQRFSMAAFYQASTAFLRSSFYCSELAKEQLIPCISAAGSVAVLDAEGVLVYMNMNASLTGRGG
jgi:hypothetical protein